MRLGRGIRALRRRRGWRQADLASAARCSQALISRLELGQGDAVLPRRLESVARALGARTVLYLDWNGESLDRLLDADHASLVDATLGALGRQGWSATTEVTFAVFGERGSIDVLAWHPSSRSLLVVEVKSVLADVQDTIARLDRKVRLAPQIAPAEWRPRTVSSLLVIADSRTNRRRVEGLSTTFQAAFPDRHAAVRSFLRSPGPQPIRGLVFLTGTHRTSPRHRIRPLEQTPRARGASIDRPASDSHSAVSERHGFTDEDSRGEYLADPTQRTGRRAQSRGI